MEVIAAVDDCPASATAETRSVNDLPSPGTRFSERARYIVEIFDIAPPIQVLDDVVDHPVRRAI
jgi:hypothetical protein